MVVGVAIWLWAGGHTVRILRQLHLCVGKTEESAVSPTCGGCLGQEKWPSRPSDDHQDQGEFVHLLILFCLWTFSLWWYLWHCIFLPVILAPSLIFYVFSGLVDKQLYYLFYFISRWQQKLNVHIILSQFMDHNFFILFNSFVYLLFISLFLCKHFRAANEVISIVERMLENCCCFFVFVLFFNGIRSLDDLKLTTNNRINMRIEEETYE